MHIAVAMGRRKLTRILIEAGCDKTIKNAQGETAQDIAIRKNLSEILSILENTKQSKSPHRDRSSSSSARRHHHLSKDESKRKSRRDKGTDKVDGETRYWSPYGCHYSPDPKDFPSPKLETLPKEPLQKGEQYYLDLAGNIRKGPIGVGNVCYCAPLFRHLEHRISKNKKSIKKIVEKVDHKLDALANRTDDQIENLTKSIIADRIRCEDKKLYLKSWLKRGILQRQSLAPGKVCKDDIHDDHNHHGTLTRCRSLELIDPDAMMLKTSTPASGPTAGGLSRSVDLLNCHSVTVHREAELESDAEETNSNAKNHSDREKSSVSNAKESSTSGISDGRKISKFKINKEPKHIRLKKKHQTKQRDDTKFDQDSLSEGVSADFIDDDDGDIHTTMVTRRLEKLLLETKTMLEKEKLLQKISRSKESPMREQLFEQLQSSRRREYDKSRNIEAEMERITKTLSQSLNLDVKEDIPCTSDENEEYVDDDDDKHFVSTSFSRNVQEASEDEDSQDDEEENEVQSQMDHQMMHGFFMNTEFTSPLSSSHQSPLTVRETPDICRTSRELNELKSRILGNTNWRSNVLRKSAEEVEKSHDVVDANTSTMVPSGMVKKMISKMQDGTGGNGNNTTTIPMPRFSLMDPNLIPKDAYFHELPKNRTNIALPARTRNPLPIDVNENDLMRDDAILPSSTTKNIYSNVQMPLPRVQQTRPPIPIKPPHLNYDRDSQNDSGYSGKLYDNSSHNPSPISNQTVENHEIMNGNLPSRNNNNLPSKQIQKDSQNEQYYATKIGASSLV